MRAKGPTMRSRGGLSRGPDEPTPAELRAPNLWLLDYREGGTFCVLDPAVLMLWRPNMQGDTATEIERGGTKTTVAIVDGANLRKWPTDILPVHTGATQPLPDDGSTHPGTTGFPSRATAHP